MPGDLSELEALLADVPTDRPRRKPRRRRYLARGLAWVAPIAAALALPFVVLIRTATEAHAGGLGPWPALALGGLASLLLLLAYVAVLGYRLRGTARLSRRVCQGLAALVAAYCLYCLVYLSGANAKSEAVRAEYTALHPVMRVAVSTLVLVDPGPPDHRPLTSPQLGRPYLLQAAGVPHAPPHRYRRPPPRQHAHRHGRVTVRPSSGAVPPLIGQNPASRSVAGRCRARPHTKIRQSLIARGTPRAQFGV